MRGAIRRVNPNDLDAIGIALFRNGAQGLVCFGEPGWDRTIDTVIKSHVLYH
jgi:hypothetical protein